MTTSSPRPTIAAGAAYITGWITGLLVSSDGPAATAAPATVHAYYAANGPAILLQALLVHGIPGIALAVLGISVARNLTAAGPARVWLTASAATAAALSLGQVGVALAAVTTADTAEAGTTATLFHALNLADTAKLIALAVFAAASCWAARRRGVAPGWFVALTIALVVLLPAGGAAFLIDQPVLSALLIASLPLLLVWVAALTTVVAPRATRPAPRESVTAVHLNIGLRESI
jgi:hypothetical protein